MSPELVRVGTRLAAVEMIESGTTTFVDMYYFEEEIAKATFEAGLRGVLGETIIQFPVADAKTPADGAGPGRALHQGVQGQRPHRPGRRAARALHQRQGHAAGGRGARRGSTACPIIIHFAETEDEVQMARDQYQMTPTRVPRVDRRSGGRTTLGGAWRLGHRRRHRDSEADGRRASRTTRKAT